MLKGSTKRPDILVLEPPPPLATARNPLFGVLHPLAQSYVADTVRAALPTMGVIEESTVIALQLKGSL
jgi:hypothetical protein